VRAHREFVDAPQAVLITEWSPPSVRQHPNDERMVMTDKVKNTALVVTSLAALALGGSAIAGAASNDNAAGTDAATTQADDAQPQRQHGQRADEDLLTGDTASKVRAAALARVAGGTIERVETDADGHAAYEAHMTNADGGRVTVYVNEQFEVVSVESGR
jgi:uncharacterized membrane protein YkoI